MLNLFTMKKATTPGILLLNAVLSATSLAADSKLKSAGALAFGPDNVLAVGDNCSGAVHAFESKNTALDDQKGNTLGRAQSFEGRTLIDNFDQQVAAIPL